jgi:hypothetical protein
MKVHHKMMFAQPKSFSVAVEPPAAKQVINRIGFAIGCLHDTRKVQLLTRLVADASGKA